MDALEIWMPRKGDAHVLEARATTLGAFGTGQATVRIEAAGVAYADISMRACTYPRVKTPVMPGHGAVGRIVAIGSGVDDLAIGDRVAGITVTSCYASARHVDAALLVRAPEGTDAAKLVPATLNGPTAWQMLTRATARERGEWILAHGASGGVGTLMLDMARLAEIKAIGTSPARHRYVVAGYGAVAVDYRETGFLRREPDISDGGVFAAYDHIGGRHFRSRSMAALGPGGAGVPYGAYEVSRGGRLAVRGPCRTAWRRQLLCIDADRAGQRRRDILVRYKGAPPGRDVSRRYGRRFCAVRKRGHRPARGRLPAT